MPGTEEIGGFGHFDRSTGKFIPVEQFRRPPRPSQSWGRRNWWIPAAAVILLVLGLLGTGN